MCGRLRAEPNNRYRLLRMLEVALTARRPRAELDHDRAAPLEYDFRRFFLARPREELYRRIDERCERIAADGLLPVCTRTLHAMAGVTLVCACVLLRGACRWKGSLTQAAVSCAVYACKEPPSTEKPEIRFSPFFLALG